MSVIELRTLSTRYPVNRAAGPRISLFGQAYSHAIPDYLYFRTRHAPSLPPTYSSGSGS